MKAAMERSWEAMGKVLAKRGGGGGRSTTRPRASGRKNPGGCP